MPRSRVLLAAALAVLALGVVLWLRAGPPAPGVDAPVRIPPDGPITIALAGDTLLGGAIAGASARPVFDSLRAATIGIANLDMNLLDDDTLADPARWPFGTARDARTLRAIGIDAVSLANNHAIDYGESGLRATARVLDAHAILHAGTGADLAGARAAVVAGSGARGIALISVTTSSSEEARATLTRGDIKGRPGVNPLRYRAEVTADPRTFASLQSTAEMLQAGDVSDDGMTLFGTTIRRGAETAVAFLVDADDVREVLDTVRAARDAAAIVVVAVHSHEPDNASEMPAGFVRDFAHHAIDAGASLVVGHGPHRLRGIERYGAGVILYSLGNFIYPAGTLDPRAADTFDAGTDLFARAVGMLSGVSGEGRFDEAITGEAWWESVVAVATFEDGGLTDLALHPIDLGVDRPLADRGIPEPAAAARAAGILGALTRLSAGYDTRVTIDNGVGRIDLR
jgi:poly-gamma-glutamate synthesis protein (capsule biosynthesis protein)